jgi:hypothetical protein
MTRRIASAARLAMAARTHRTVLQFKEGGSLTLRGATVLQEEQARGLQQGEIADMVAGRGLLSRYGLADQVGAAGADQILGLSGMLYAAHLGALCAVALEDIESEDGTPLAPDATGLFALMAQDSDACQQLVGWSLAPPAFWTDEGNVSGLPSPAHGPAAPNPQTSPERESASAS